MTEPGRRPLPPAAYMATTASDMQLTIPAGSYVSIHPHAAKDTDRSEWHWVLRWAHPETGETGGATIVDQSWVEKNFQGQDWITAEDFKEVLGKAALKRPSGACIGGACEEKKQQALRQAQARAAVPSSVPAGAAPTTPTTPTATRGQGLISGVAIPRPDQ